MMEATKIEINATVFPDAVAWLNENLPDLLMTDTVMAVYPIEVLGPELVGKSHGPFCCVFSEKNFKNKIILVDLGAKFGRIYPYSILL